MFSQAPEEKDPLLIRRKEGASNVTNKRRLSDGNNKKSGKKTKITTPENSSEKSELLPDYEKIIGDLQADEVVYFFTDAVANTFAPSESAVSFKSTEVLQNNDVDAKLDCYVEVPANKCNPLYHTEISLCYDKTDNSTNTLDTDDWINSIIM